MHDTKLALRRWNETPGAVLRPWCLLSAAIAVTLLFAVYAVAKFTTPDQTRYLIPGYNIDATFGDYVHVLIRNSLVLSLHALACIAGFMAGGSPPPSASKRSGLHPWGHQKGGPPANRFLVCATPFSLLPPALILRGPGPPLPGP